MFTVRVIPITRGFQSEYLTFFSRAPVEIGSVVPITIRGRLSHGIVVGYTDVRDEKQDLRTAPFALKKLGKAEPKRIFTSPFMNAARQTALWHGIHESEVISHFAPRTILSSISRVHEAPHIESLTDVKPDMLILQAERDERVRTYRNIARESFARNESLLIITPSLIEAESLVPDLMRGIDESVVLLTGELPKKKFLDTWNRIATDVRPLLIVGTSIALAAPRIGVSSIIIERESSRSYRGIQRPHIDVRILAEHLSRETGARFIAADFPVRVESRYKVELGDADELARSQVRPSGSAEIRVIDTRKKETLKGEKRVFSPLTDDAKRIMETELRREGRVAVYASRRGISPLTVCNDCGTPVTDPSTGAPMTLHKTPSGNVFMSHRSGATLPSEISCATCRGWNLVTLGIGVDRVHADLEKSFPKTKIVSLTRDSAKTHSSAKKVARQFYGDTGTIIVGTERMLPYLTEPVESIIVASLDSMLSRPQWRANEYALSMLYYLWERSLHSFVIETRRSDHEIMKSILAGNPLDFYRSEIRERKKYGYPPASVFIGLSVRGTRTLVDSFATLIKETFNDLDVVGPLPASQEGRNEWSARAVVRLERASWPNAELSDRLRALPPYVDVEIDPDEIV